MDTNIIILAAGKGSRMRVAQAEKRVGKAGARADAQAEAHTQAKALRLLGGEPLLAHVLRAVEGLSAAVHVVVGDDAEAVRARFPDADVTWHTQQEPLGTGHAARCALDNMGSLGDDARVVVLCVDTPLLEGAAIAQLVETLDDGDMAVLTARFEQPQGYGRIARDADGEVVGIIEQSDLTPASEAISEVNTGVIAARAECLREILPRVGRENAQGEYYLTDCVGIARADGLRVRTATLRDATQAAGVNTPLELHRAERYFYRRRAEDLINAGVTVRDAERLEVRGAVVVGRDVEIDIGVILEGDVRLGDGARVGAHCILKDAEIGDATEIKPMTLIEGARVGRECRVGPFARIRPHTVLDDGAAVGNYVEVKNSRLGEGAKAGHLSYLGDSDVGREVNVGAGVVTCNYDGVDKHKTVVGDRVFIGSGAQLVAPIRVGDDATIGAGSTLSRDVEGGGLTLTRAEAKTIKPWRRGQRRGAGS